jgi:short-subunit dehydrogenase
MASELSRRFNRWVFADGRSFRWRDAVHVELKSLAKQVMVITGATSGHGLRTAQKAAAVGARVMLAARNEPALIAVCDEIRMQGGVADYVVTDVGREKDVRHLAEKTIKRFGGFDTWVNNAGIGIYAAVRDLDPTDHRKLFETNYWGVVHGSVAALDHFADNGPGAIINVGSINSDMGSPLLASYNASKHAVKGFTDSLRIEMIDAGLPVSVTLIKPSAIGTPFPQHAHNRTGFAARLPRPIYSPDLVADAILDAARHPRRSITVGGAGKFQILGATLLPSLFDRIAGRMTNKLIDRDRPIAMSEGNLHAPAKSEGKVEGEQEGRGFSSFTSMRRHPVIATTALGILTVGALAFLNRRKVARD